MTIIQYKPPLRTSTTPINSLQAMVYSIILGEYTYNDRARYKKLQKSIMVRWVNDCMTTQNKYKCMSVLTTTLCTTMNPNNTECSRSTRLPPLKFGYPLLHILVFSIRSLEVICLVPKRGLVPL